MTNPDKTPLILVADDQQATVVMLERVFEFEGYNVKSVYDGIAALQAANELSPDLILLDINMPGMNGFEVLKELRDNPSTKTIPTIMITAVGEFTDVVHGLNLGADDYLRKPFHPQELLARAQSKIRARKLEDSLQRRTQELEALLRVSEELSQHLDISELLNFVLYLVLDLLPCDIAAIYRIDSDHVAECIIREKDGTEVQDILNHGELVNWTVREKRPTLWYPEAPMVPGFGNGILVPMQYGNEVSGILLVASHEAFYDENNMRLLHGIGRQAALALRNAELYEIQANYAQHLEDMVAERTRALESAQEMLIRSEKLASVGRLAASIAHEIKNPLFPIQINLDDMLEDIRSGHSIREDDIVRTLESVERIRHIVDNLLDFTGKRQGASDFKPVDINKALDSIIGLNRKAFEQENIRIQTNLGQVSPIFGNKYQLEQVFMNLMINARDAMTDNGVIDIETYEQNAQVIINVSDNGSGIPQEVIENIFEPFVSTKEDGNGLGLFISYGIIQNHKGTIEVKSEPGHGTQFQVKFPALK